MIIQDDFEERVVDMVANIPLSGRVTTTLLSMSTMAVLSACITRRVKGVRKWNKLPATGWMLMFIYIDSLLFVITTAIITQSIGVNTSEGVCTGAILLCLICYMTTKWAIYCFLVEKAYIIRGGLVPRRKDKLYLFNFFLFLCPYFGIIVLNFVYKIAYIDPNGTCIIGMEKISMLPLIIFDVVVNVYLTILFIIPLRRLYSYKKRINMALRRMALRTFIGACAALTSSVVNLTVLMVLRGEPGWVCLMCCNADILFCVLILHWVTAIDRQPRNPTQNPTGCPRCPSCPHYNPNSLLDPGPHSRSWPTGHDNPHRIQQGSFEDEDAFMNDPNLSFITSALHPLASVSCAPTGDGRVDTHIVGGAEIPEETEQSDQESVSPPKGSIKVRWERNCTTEPNGPSEEPKL